MELLIYIATLCIGYYLWMKIKCFFTGRSVSDQMAHDEARSNQRVCAETVSTVGAASAFNSTRVSTATVILAAVLKNNSGTV